MWGMYQQSVTPQIGAQVNVLIFIVIIIGGLGLDRRLLRRRAAGRPDGQLRRLPRARSWRCSRTSLLMVAVLLWRPQGLYPVERQVRDRMLATRLPAPHDLPRSRVLAVVLLADRARRWRSRRSCSPARGAERRGQDLRLHRAGRQLRPAARLHRHRLLRAHDVLRHRRLRHRDREHAHRAELAGGRRRHWPARWRCRCVLSLRDRPVLAAGARRSSSR